MSLPSHPFQSIPAEKRRVVFFILLGVTLLTLGVLGTFYRLLNNAAAPQGMVSLELARTPDQFQRMLASWSDAVRLRLAFTVGLNFLCLFALTNTLALACLWAAEKWHSRREGVAQLGVALAWGQWVAGVSWAVQNSLLAAILFGFVTPFSAEAAYWLALLKFSLTGAGLSYSVLAGTAAAFTRH